MASKKVNLLKYKQEYLWNLKELIAFQTFLWDENEGSYPIKEQYRALKFLVELGKSYGFRSYLDSKGHYAYLEIGEGKELVGILGHIDVVSPGDLSKWKTPPFKLVFKNEELYGRGVIDDKGPVLLALYVMKALLDLKVSLNKRFRLIIGTDEEVLWRGMNKYLKHEEIPSMGFTPDAFFPIIYAEKGLLQWYVEDDSEAYDFKIYGGDSINVVPDSAYYEGVKVSQIVKHLKQMPVKYQIINENKLLVIGKSAHAMEPEKGINALGYLFIALKKVGYQQKLVQFIADKIGGETTGETLFEHNFFDQETGNLTLNLGKVSLEKGKLRAWFDQRIPVVATNREEIEALLSEKLKIYDLEYCYFDFLKPIFVNPDSDFINLLMESYKKYIDDGKKPYTLGGATYARAVENVFAFGPMLASDQNLEHQPNEMIKFSTLKVAFDIYLDSLIEINKLK